MNEIQTETTFEYLAISEKLGTYTFREGKHELSVLFLRQNPVSDANQTDRTCDAPAWKSRTSRSKLEEGRNVRDKPTSLVDGTNENAGEEGQDFSSFQITVRDDGRPPLFSTTRVVVEVADINDHGPEFEQKFYTVQIPASPTTDKPLFQVSIAS
ncbi:hypothetical protein KM043_005055 [Ampulex compressa]|nr:hypothetical protein KM043_005055 [Ampulex compressa]